MIEGNIFPDVLKSIKINVFIFQHKSILVKENIYLPDDRESVKLERHTNADLKISLNVCVHIKTIP